MKKFFDILRDTAGFVRREFDRIGGTRVFFIMFGLLIFLALLAGTFETGVRVGFERAKFVRDIDDRFVRTIDAPNNVMIRGTDQFPDPHGSVGTIVSTYPSGFIIEDRDGIEKAFTVDDDTLVRDGRKPTDLQAIRVGTFVIIVGEPETSGTINARLIRIIPQPF